MEAGIVAAPCVAERQVNQRTRRAGQGESVLIERLRAGDDDAYESIMREQGPRLLAVARRFLRNEECARDAVQDAFIAAFRSIDQFEAGSRLSTWLHRITVNCCLMKIRKDKRCRESSLESLLPAFLDDGHQVEASSDWGESIDDAMVSSEMRQIVRASIDQLPDSYRVVLLLRDIEEMSTNEAAKLLDVTPNVVKVRLHRARQALRTLLDPYMERR